MGQKSKLSFNLLMIIMSAIFLVYALSFLLNCMIEYKYHIQENFDHAPLYYTYLDRKIELGVVMWYLGIGACYLLVMILYFYYQLMNKRKDNAKQERILNAIVNDDIQYLSQVEFDVNARLSKESWDYDTIFLYAMGTKTFSHFTYLLEKHPDLFATNQEGENVIHSMVFSGDLNRLKIMFSICFQLLNIIDARSEDGTTPLLSAILLGHYDIASFLIDSKANVNMCDNEEISPLHVACGAGCLPIVQKLISQGANIFKESARGYPLAWAVNEDKKEVVKYVVNNYY